MTPETDADLFSQRRYSSVAIVLHWLLAFAVVCQLALGFTMPKDESGFAAYQLHKSIGITILLLTLVRLAWRVFRRPPPLVEGGFGGILAKAVHWGFYAVLILGPLTGWLVVSTATVRVPTILFGVVPWSHLPVSAAMHEVSEEAHEWLGWIAVGLLALHVAGAVRHHVILRDRLLERMAPAGSGAWAITLAGAVALAGGATLMLVGRAAQTAQRPALAAAAPVQPAPASEAPDEAIEPEPAATEQAEAEPAAPPTWAIAPGGRLGFSIANGGDQLIGSFSRWSGRITFDPERPETADLRIDVDLASASLGDATMDGMLAEDEFFAVSAHPSASWRSTSVRRTGPNRYSARGTLSLKGVSRPQALTFTLSGTGLRRSVSGSATVDRAAFDIGTGSSGASLGARVSLDFAFDAVGSRD
jgi:cytochrome b561/polyisoprenoid-binding protein YceI